jgi:hypothetical protein
MTSTNEEGEHADGEHGQRDAASGRRANADVPAASPR